MDPVVSEVVSVLERSPSVLRALLQDLPDSWLDKFEGEETFGPREVLAHLIHGERTDWVPRIKLILEHGDTRPFVPFDRRGFGEASRIPVGGLLEEFETLRKANLAFLASAVFDLGTNVTAGSTPRTRAGDPRAAAGHVGCSRSQPHRAGTPGDERTIRVDGWTLEGVPSNLEPLSDGAAP